MLSPIGQVLCARFMPPPAEFPIQVSFVYDIDNFMNDSPDEVIEKAKQASGPRQPIFGLGARTSAPNMLASVPSAVAKAVAVPTASLYPTLFAAK